METSITKKAGKQLSTNKTLWPAEVLEALYSTFPELSSYPNNVNFTSRNDDKGAAFGNISVGPMLIPFLIENSELKPMIVYYLNNQSITDSMPLTKSNIYKILYSKSFEKGLVSKSQIATSNSQREYQRDVYQVKNASLLRELDGTVKHEDIVSLMEKVASDRETYTNILQNAHTGLLLEVDKLSCMQKRAGAITQSRDIYYIGNFGTSGLIKKSSSAGIYCPASENVPESILESEDRFKASDRNKIAAVMQKKAAAGGDSVTYGGVESRYVEVVDMFTKKASTVLMSSNGTIYNNTEVQAPMQFMEKKAEMACTRLPQVNKFYMIKTAENSFTPPIRVMSACTVEGVAEVHGQQACNNIHIKECGAIKEAMFDKKASTLFVPSLECFEVASIGKLKKEITKEATAKNSIVVSNNTYALRGPVFKEFSRITKSASASDKDSALWTLIQLGASKDTIEKIASSGPGVYKITDNLSCPVTYGDMEKIASEELNSFRSFISTKIHGLLKEASSIADKGSMDVVLGLNLINEENISILVQNVQLLDAALNSLCRLWLMTITGLKAFNEYALEQVIIKLSDVRDTIEQLGGALSASKANKKN